MDELKSIGVIMRQRTCSLVPMIHRPEPSLTTGIAWQRDWLSAESAAECPGRSHHLGRM